MLDTLFRYQPDAAMGFAADANDHRTHAKPVRPDRGGDER
jgi:hypothetical protein